MVDKLFPSYESEPYKVVVQSPQGVEFKRNPQHFKPMPNQDIGWSAEPKRELPGQAPIP